MQSSNPLALSTTIPTESGSGSTVVRRNPSRNNRERRFHRFVFTINNWTTEELDWLTTQFKPKWMIIGKEGLETTTPHLQCACILVNATTMSALKNKQGFRRAHIEMMGGKPIDSMVYCSKEDTTPYIYGVLPAQGKRNDLHEITDRIRNGESLRDLAKDDVGAVAIVKYHKGLTILRSLSVSPRDPKYPPTVVWLYGKTGTSKTRCSTQLGRLYGEVWMSSGGLRWFDGYDGQFTAIIDDFRSKQVQFSFLLRLLDRYPMTVEFKGGHVNWAPKLIFITSNKKPEKCFLMRNEHIPEDIEQLKRRITKVIKYVPLRTGAFATTVQLDFESKLDDLKNIVNPLINF